MSSAKFNNIESQIHNHEVEEQKKRENMYKWIIIYTVKMCDRPDITANKIIEKLMTNNTSLKFRKNKDLPKGKKNGYQVYCDSITEEVKQICKLNREKNTKEWELLSEEEHNYYNEKAKFDDANKKKNGFHVFCNEKNPDNPFSEYSKRWSTLSEEEKEQFNEMAKDDSLRYDEAKRKFNADQFEKDGIFAAELRQIEKDYLAGINTTDTQKLLEKPRKSEMNSVKMTTDSMLVTPTMNVLPSVIPNHDLMTETSTKNTKVSRNNKKKEEIINASIY